jgi:hypothetical protein
MPLPCGLCDISLGGVGLTLPGLPAPAIDRGQILQLQLRLPGVASDAASPAQAPLHLQLLGEVRHVQQTALPWTLHVRFLQRLPAVVNGLFAALAQRGLCLRPSRAAVGADRRADGPHRTLPEDAPC